MTWITVSYLFTAGAIFFAGLVNTFYFHFRQAVRASKFLSIVCMAFGLNILLPNTSGLPLATIFRWLDSILVFRLDLITLAAGIGAAGPMLREFFLMDVSGKIVFPLVWLSAATMVLGALLPQPALELLYKCYVGIVILFCFYCLYIGCIILMRKRSDSYTIALGIFFVSATGGADANIILLTGSPGPLTLQPFGLLVLTLLMSYIVAKRFSESITTAEGLRNDLMNHKNTLRIVQRRMVKTLNRIPLPVVAIKMNGEIAFANQHACKLLENHHGLIGVKIDSLVKLVTAGNSSEMPFGKLCAMCWVDKTISVNIDIGNGCQQRRDMELAQLGLGDEKLTVMIFHSCRESAPDELTIDLFLNELNRNKKRLNQLIKKLAPDNQVNSSVIRADLDAIDSALDQLSAVLKKQEPDRRAVARKIMSLSLAYWEESTGRSRLELARESGLWLVEVTPDGFERARTLDKYLDIRTLPHTPRWKKVLATSDFVLSYCSGNLSLRRELEEAASCLRIS